MDQTSRFPVALGISMLLHVILVSLLVLNILPAEKVLNQIEVNYLKLKPKAISFEKRAVREFAQKDFEKIVPGQHLILSDWDKIAEKSSPAQRISPQDELLFKSKDVFPKPALTKTEFIKPQTIKLSPLEIDPSTKVHDNPAYLTYNNYLHERIRHSIHNKFYYINGKGTVYLKFTLNADGSLLEAYVVDDKSNASNKLKQIALDGLKNAAPFPVLPKELHSLTATFWVNVHFIEEKI